MKYSHRRGDYCITTKPRFSAFLLSEAIISLLILSLTLPLAMGRSALLSTATTPINPFT